MRRTNAFIKLTASSFLLVFFTISQAFAATQLQLAQSSTNESNQDGSVRIIDPKKEVPVAKSAAIDDEHFELGLFAGFLSVEDFNTNPVYGLSFSYHLTPKWMLQLNYGESEVGRANFESNSGTNRNFLGDREFSHYEFMGGYRVLRGRSFVGANKKYNSDIYVLAGLGSVDFGDEKNTSFVIGASYRVVLTDFLVANMDFRGYSVDRQIASIDDDKRTFNTELSLGLNFLF